MKISFRKNNLKWGFYFLCFFVLCVCDQQIGSASGEMQLVCPNIVLSVLSCIALSHYPLSGYGRRLFWMLSLPCAAVAGVVLLLKWPGAYYPWQLASGAVAAFFYCCVLIQTGFAVYSAKGIPKGRRPGVAMLFLLLVCILLSYHDKYNGLLLCLSVIFLYLTDFTDQEFEGLLKALGAALLAAFFLFQGLAFVFRPYDTLRYLGMYANTNMNALLYQMVYCVFFSYFCIMEVKREHPFVRVACFCFACAMWGFVLLTMCRSAMLGMAAATVLGFGIVLRRQGKGRRLRRGLVYAGGFVLAAALAFPVVYGAVRYLPPVFHHPIWFMDEYSEDKVHSWDGYDSEKYTDWRDVLQGNFGRLFMNLIPLQISLGQEAEAVFWTGGGNPAAVCRPPVVLCAAREGDLGFPGEAPKGEETDRNYSVSARFRIYGHYLSQLNLRGHRDSENGLQVDENYYAPHAHNMILQYAFNYGVPAGVILLLYLAFSGIRLLLACLGDDTGMHHLLPLLLFASIAAFGMLEVVWRYGQLSHTLLLLLPCFAWRQAETSGSAGSPLSGDRG